VRRRVMEARVPGRRRARRGAKGVLDADRAARVGAVVAKGRAVAVKASAVAARADVVVAMVRAHAAKAPADVVSVRAKDAAPGGRARDAGAVRHPAPDRLHSCTAAAIYSTARRVVFRS